MSLFNKIIEEKATMISGVLPPNLKHSLLKTARATQRHLSQSDLTT